MTVTVNKSKASGSISAPPSKSMAHRLLICAALSDGSVVKNIDYSDDINATLGCLEALGARVDRFENSVNIGGLDFENVKSNKLFCNESGSTLRFLIPLSLCFKRDFEFTGSERLFERPLFVFDEIFKNSNVNIEKQNTSLTVSGKITSGDYYVRGDVSSQYISGLMFALCVTEGRSTVNITGNIESVPYIDMTVSALLQFGADIRKEDCRTYNIVGKHRLCGHTVTVEGDYSNAAFLDAFNFLGGDVTVSGLKPNSLQADKVYKDCFAKIANGTPTLDIKDCPDLAPVLFALAAAKNGAVFNGTSRLKYKESDRGAAMIEELLKFGVTLIEKENSITVKKSVLNKPISELCGHNDHRIVMALTVLLTLTGGSISGAEAVNKSFPMFFENLRKIGIDLGEKCYEYEF